MTVRCTNHCASCGKHFHSLDSFDAHRRGSHASGRHCVSPFDINETSGSDRFVSLADDGVCALGSPSEQGATIWTLAAGRDRARRAFSRGGERLEAAAAA